MQLVDVSTMSLQLHLERKPVAEGMGVCRKHGSVQMWQYVGTASTAAKGQGQPPDSREASFDAMHGLRMLLPH